MVVRKCYRIVLIPTYSLWRIKPEVALIALRTGPSWNNAHICYTRISHIDPDASCAMRFTVVQGNMLDSNNSSPSKGREVNSRINCAPRTFIATNALCLPHLCIDIEASPGNEAVLYIRAVALPIATVAKVDGARAASSTDVGDTARLRFDWCCNFRAEEQCDVGECGDRTHFARDHTGK